MHGHVNVTCSAYVHDVHGGVHAVGDHNGTVRGLSLHIFGSRELLTFWACDTNFQASLLPDGDHFPILRVDLGMWEDSMGANRSDIDEPTLPCRQTLREGEGALGLGLRALSHMPSLPGAKQMAF